MYSKDERTKRCVIIKNSPLGVVVSVLMLAKQSSHHASYPIPFSRLGRDIIALTQQNWASNFKSTFGSLVSFIRLYDEVIFVQENNQSPKNPFVRLAPSIDEYEIQLVSDVEFSKAFVSTQSDQIVLQSSPVKPVETHERVTNVDDFMHRGDHMEYFDSDEALAKAIQSSLEAEDLKAFTEVSTKEEKWEVAGVKKKDKKTPLRGNGKQKQQEIGGMKIKSVQFTGNKGAINNRPLTVQSSSKPIHTSAKDKSGSVAVEEPLQNESTVLDVENEYLDEEKLKLGIIAHLKNRILNSYFGPFFNFNDSTVTSMELSSLEKSFEGPDSAYLLVYRKENVMVSDSISLMNLLIAFLRIGIGQAHH